MKTFRIFLENATAPIDLKAGNACVCDKWIIFRNGWIPFDSEIAAFRADKVRCFYIVHSDEPKELIEHK